MSDSFELIKVKKVKGAWEPKGDTAPASIKPSAWFAEGTLCDHCSSGGTVDTADLESAALKSVEVQIFSGALDNMNYIVYNCLMRN